MLGFVYALLLVSFHAFVVLNTSWEHSHIFFGDPMPPGPLVSERYTFTWFVYALQGLRAAVVVLIFATVLDRKRFFFFDLTKIILTFFFIADIVWLFIYFLLWCVRNTSMIAANPANDDRFCCVFFASNPQICANTVPCPGVGADDLTTNGVFVAGWMLVGVFAVLDFALIFVTELFFKYVRRSRIKGFQ